LELFPLSAAIFCARASLQKDIRFNRGYAAAGFLLSWP